MNFWFLKIKTVLEVEKVKCKTLEINLLQFRYDFELKFTASAIWIKTLIYKSFLFLGDFMKSLLNVVWFLVISKIKKSRILA